MIQAFPKPKDKKQSQPAVKSFPGGREVCQNNKAGKDEYERRRRAMWERQGKMCGLQISPQCMRRLPWQYATFEHVDGRGFGGSTGGGGKRDDRIEKDGKPYNLAVCPYCNVFKGSRRINYEEDGG